MEENYFVRDTLSERTADFIRRGILYLGTYKNGDHILEMEISEQLQVSRTTVREALKSLEAQGIVEITPRRGTYVAAFDHEDMVEILELRCMCEAYIFKRLLDGCLLAEEDFLRLERIIDEMVGTGRELRDKSLDRSEAFTSKDLEFHGYLWNKSGCRWFCKILSDNYYRLRLAMMQDMMLEGNMERSAVMHYDILNALKGGDVEGACRHLREHILTLHGIEIPS